MQYIFLIVFFVLISTYHLRHTFLGYSVAWFPSEYLSVGKDLLWIVGVCTIFLCNKSQVSRFVRDRKRIILMFSGLVLRSLILSWYEGMSWGSIVVGAKYDIYPLFVLLSALGIGYCIPRVKRRTWSLSWLQLFLLLLGVGLLRQCGKHMFPDFFYWRGYGPVGDYTLGMNPPIYYRTGPGGIPRLQGIFAGPNNYGFFLVGIGGIVTTLFLSGTKKLMHRLVTVLYVFSLGWTLSRGAWIGAGIASILTVWYFFPQYKKRLISLCCLGAIGVLLLSMSKAGSTSGHRIALVEGMHAFARQPWGYGLGMAGPSVHYEGVYLPENQYMQILLDLGVGGFLLWIGVLFGIVRKMWTMRIQVDSYLVAFLFGIVGMSVEGLFLHVREDSMVNYLILGALGLWYGMLHQDLSEK